MSSQQEGELAQSSSAGAQSAQEGAQAGGDTGSGLVSQLTGGMETVGESGESRKQKVIKSTYCT